MIPSAVVAAKLSFTPASTSFLLLVYKWLVICKPNLLVFYIYANNLVHLDTCQQVSHTVAKNAPMLVQYPSYRLVPMWHVND